MASWKTLAARRRMNREDEGIQEISHDQALIKWSAHKLLAERLQREPSRFFFPEVTPLQVALERMGEEINLDSQVIDLAIIRLDVYATICRNQEDGWEKTERTREVHRRLSREKPELWQASDVMVLSCIDEYQRRRPDALELGPVTIDPSRAKVLN